MRRKLTLPALLSALALACAADSAGPGDAQLAFSTDEHDFGDILLGMSSETLSLVLVNRGAAPSGQVTVTLTGQHAGDFTITRDLCTGTHLPSGGTCIVDVLLHPTSGGGKEAVVRADIAPDQTVAITLSGNGRDAGLAFSSDSVLFGDNVTGTTRVRSVSLRNAALVTTGSLAVELTGPGASAFTITNDGCQGQTLALAVSCAFDIRYTAGSPGESEATLTVRGAPGGEASARLRGASGTPTTLAASPGTEDFGLQRSGQLSTARRLTVTNQGAAASGTIQSVLAGTNVNDFAVSANDCSGRVLQPAASCDVWVRFIPTSTGPRTATLDISGSFGSTASVQLSGLGGSVVIMATLFQLDFGSVPVGSASLDSVDVRNDGTMTSGAVTGSFGCPANSVCELPFSFVNSCGPLAPGASCRLYVRFAPTAPGLYQIPSTVGDGPSASVVTLIGLGT
jgi:hypothetical protein